MRLLEEHVHLRSHKLVLQTLQPQLQHTPTLVLQYTFWLRQQVPQLHCGDATAAAENEKGSQRGKLHRDCFLWSRFYMVRGWVLWCVVMVVQPVLGAHDDLKQQQARSEPTSGAVF